MMDYAEAIKVAKKLGIDTSTEDGVIEIRSHKLWGEGGRGFEVRVDVGAGDPEEMIDNMSDIADTAKRLVRKMSNPDGNFYFDISDSTLWLIIE